MGQLLERRGHDPSYAERFFQLGLSKKAAAKWIQKFSPEDAFGWIAVRFGLIEATKWDELGYTVGEATRLKPLKLSPEQISAIRTHPLAKFDVDIEVIVARGELGLDGDETAVVWAEHGWDLLASIPWSLTGFDSSSARSWEEQGFDPLWAKRLAPSFGPAEAGRWSATSVDAAAWEEWRTAGFCPSEADGFAGAGFNINEAIEWRDDQFSLEQAADYRGAGLDVVAADHWRAAGVSSGDIGTWLDLDLKPTDLERWRSLSEDPAAIKALSKSGLSPEGARAWLDVGVASQAITRWETVGLAPDEAKVWAYTSPARAIRLIAKGISPEVDRARRAAGAERVALARTALAERRDPVPRKQGRRDNDVTRPQVVAGIATSHCFACNLAVGVNGRCGCS